jgi:hypothetical protein
MAEAQDCENYANYCDVEIQQEQQDIDDPSISILQETEAGPVEAGPPGATFLTLASSYPNFLFLYPTGNAEAANADTRDQGYVESDDSVLNVSQYTSRQKDPLSISVEIMNFIEQSIKSELLVKFHEMFIQLHIRLSTVVPDMTGMAKGFVGITMCGFLSKYTTVIYYAGRIPYGTIVPLITHWFQQLDQIVRNWNGVISEVIGKTVEFACKHETSPIQYDTQKIILCIKLKSSGNIIQIPILNLVGFPVFQNINLLLELLECVNTKPLCCFLDPTSSSTPPQTLSLLDIIVRVRMCANQGAITALSEPSKEEVLLIRSCFQSHHLLSNSAISISNITQAIQTALYPEANTKPFALFCNIFYNFINVSLGFRSLAKIIYSDFFGNSDNYGKVIRACRVVNRLPIMIERVKFFLTGSNAARVYVALNDIINLGATISIETIPPILSKTFGNLSDNDFMIYLNRDSDEPYRVFIRMILGGSFYFFKDLFDNATKSKFTLEMIQSVGIVGYMDHLFAQRFDTTALFLQECYQKDHTSFLADILPTMETFFPSLDKQINVAHLDGVFKYYTLEKFYKSILSICNSIPLDITNLEALKSALTTLTHVIQHIIITPAIVHDEIKSDTINAIFTKFLNFYTNFIHQLTTNTSGLPTGTLVFYPTAESLISLDNLIMLLDEIIKYMTKHNINYFYFENKDDKGNIISRQTSIELIQTVLGIFENFKNGNSFILALDFLINKATSIDCIATVWTLVLNVLYTLFVPENCLARIAVGKFDNDPKNLKLYMKILTDHLLELKSINYNQPEIGILILLQTTIADMCDQDIRKNLVKFKNTCDKWVKVMVEMATSGPRGQALFMLSQLDAKKLRRGISTRLEKALCLAYYPTQQGNICSAASNGPDIFLEELRNIFTTGPFPMDISKSTDSTNEVKLHARLNTMGEKMHSCLIASEAHNIIIQPEGNTTHLSTYLNRHWNHLTTSAIDLKNFFKENLTETKIVTGIKFIALVLGGYFQIRLLVDDVSNKCRLPGELNSFKTSQEMMACKRGLLPLLKEQPLLALIKAIIEMDLATGTNYTDPIPKILKILGFLFSIKLKSSSPHSPYQFLRLEDSIFSFPIPKDDPHERQILNPTSGMFIDFLRVLGINVTNHTIMKCICRYKDEVKKICKQMQEDVPTNLYTAVGGSNNSKSKSGRKSVSSSNKNKYKYIHTKSLKPNNHTRRNKNKRKKNSKSKTKFKTKSSSKYKKVIPSSRSGSQSNRKKSKPKKSQKNVTFKRRRARK